MALQYSANMRNSELSALSTALGAGFTVDWWSGAAPANVAAATTGTKLASFTGCNFGTPSAGSMALSALVSTTALAVNGGACGYARLLTSGGTAVAQLLFGAAQTLSTSASTAIGNAILTFSSAVDTTLIVAGMAVSGTNIPSGARVASVSGSTVTLTVPVAALVASATAVTFTPDMAIDNANVAVGQTVQLNTSTTITAGNT
jgi:hypothetical protein